MAYSEKAQLISVVAGTTFADTDLYKFIVLDTDGKAIVADNSTGNMLVLGTLYGRTATTSTDAEAVPIAIGGVVKVRMAASTAAAGNWVACSSAGLGVAPTTNNYVFGRIVDGTSGTTGRIASVAVIRGPLSTP
jgi:hypothetical protein